MSIIKRGFDRARSYEVFLAPTKKPRTANGYGGGGGGGGGIEEEESTSFSAAAGNHSNNNPPTSCSANASFTFSHLGPLQRRMSRSKSEPAAPDDWEERRDGEARMSSSSSKSAAHLTTEYDEGMYAYQDLIDTESAPRNPLSRASSCLYNLAQMCIHRGEYEEASKWLEMASTRLKVNDVRASEGDSMKLFMITHNLGYCAYRLGNLEESRQFYSDARAICLSAKLGQDPVAATDVALAVLLFHTSIDNLEPALRIMKSTLPIYWIRFGVSKQVGALLNNIGRVQYMLGNYEAAESAYEESLEIRRKCLDANSIDVAATVCNAGRAHHQQGHFDQAIECYREFLEWSRRNPDSNQRDVVIICKCMADIFRERGEKVTAKAMYEKALAMGKSTLGPYHPEVAQTLCMLGRLHYELEDLDASLEYYTEGLNIEKSLLSYGYEPQILDTLASIAQIHRQRQDSLAAFLAYAEMYALQVQLHGPNDLALSTTLSNMGLMEYQLKAYSAAFVLYQAALCIQRDHYPSDEHLCIASTLNSIGLVLFNKGDLDLAKDCFTQSLAIRTKLLGPNHHEVAVLWYNIGTVFLKSGFEDHAVRFYRETLRIERDSPDHTHPDVIVILTLNYLGLVCQERGDIDEALEYFSEALALERKQSGNTATIGKLLNLIGNIHLRGGNVGEMMKCYTEAARLFRDSGMHDEVLIIAGISYYGLTILHPPCAAQA